jgi:uncharacterized membrane protein YgcG
MRIAFPPRHFIAAPLARWVCVLAFCSLMPRVGSAQAFAPTDFSARFLDDAVCDSAILQSFIVYGREQGVSASVIQDRYVAMRGKLAELFRALLENPCGELDRRYGRMNEGSAAYAAAGDAYRAALQVAIDRALKTPASLFPLFEPDYSDRIRSFHTVVDVMKDGELKVRETITVYNGNGEQPALFESTMSSVNNDIQRGIVRDFPTRYLNSKGFWQVTGFTLKSLSRNGAPENFLEESPGNGTRIKAGNADVILDTGYHTYVLEYSTRRQLIFHPDKDELYWNVNGNGWVFTADSVSCLVRFPEGSQIHEYACYTGVQGSTARDCDAAIQSDREILFRNRKRLGSYEGLTIAVSIGKGVLVPPGKTDITLAFLRANYGLPVLAFVLLFLSMFYTRSWRRKGRDPRPGTIIPQFEPPPGISPAQAGYVLRQKYDPKFFAATLVDAAVHRDLDISVEKKGLLFKSLVYSFSRPGDGRKTPSSGIEDRYGMSVGSLYGQVAERNTYNPQIKSLNTQLERHLRETMQVSRSKDGGIRGYFALNQAYGVIGFFILLAGFVTGLFFLLNNYSKTIFLISLPLFLATLVVQVVFSRIMKAYTPEGRRITDHILGFRMYLDTAEQNLYQQLTPPEKTLELFEKYLPYAIALDVENHWAEKFSDIVQKAIDSGYQPAYFRGNMSTFSNGFRMSDLSSGISSGLSSTISSASTPPSSSSGGSGGGGSSGGGGGGGGGGGW